MHRSVRVEFDGRRSGRAPVTWAQRNMWNAIRASPPGSLNIGEVVTVADDRAVDPDQAAAAVARLMSRHEALRTQPVVCEGEVYQSVAGSGWVTVEVVESAEPAVEKTTDDLLERLLAESFRYPDEWPLRVAAVVVAGRVRRMVVVFCHFAIDGYASALVATELTRLLAGQDLGAEPALQPMDLAHRQRTAYSDHMDRVVRYYTDLHRSIPPAMFVPHRPAQDPLMHHAVLVSKAVPAAATAIAARHRVASSTVLLAATSALVARSTGNSVVALSIVVSNRFVPGCRDLVGTMAQMGLFAVDLGQSLGFDELLVRSGRSALRAYRYSFFDELPLHQAMARVREERGVTVSPYACYNDRRFAAGTAEAGPTDEAELRAAMASSEMRWPNDPFGPDCRFCLEFSEQHGNVEVSLKADTRCLPRGVLEQFLWDLEELLVTAASQPVSLGELPAGRPRGDAPVPRWAAGRPARS